MIVVLLLCSFGPKHESKKRIIKLQLQNYVQFSNKTNNNNGYRPIIFNILCSF